MIKLITNAEGIRVLWIDPYLILILLVLIVAGLMIGLYFLTIENKNKTEFNYETLYFHLRKAFEIEFYGDSFDGLYTKEEHFRFNALNNLVFRGFYYRKNLRKILEHYYKIEEKDERINPYYIESWAIDVLENIYMHYSYLILFSRLLFIGRLFIIFFKIFDEASRNMAYNRRMGAYKNNFDMIKWIPHNIKRSFKTYFKKDIEFTKTFLFLK